MVMALFFLTLTSAFAVPIEFFGEDLNPGGTVPPGGNSETARLDFLSNLVGVGTEDFEGFELYDTNLSLAFPGSTGSITATLTGGGFVVDGPGAGRFATSGDNFYNQDPGEDPFEINFSSPIAAFGFYGTDIGDFAGQILLELLNGETVNLTVPNTVGAPDGSLLFYGFIDPVDEYIKITFGNTSGSDGFGFDDMTIGDLQQVSVPDASGALLLGSSLLVLGVFRRKSKRS
jgi:hypothetical protein